MRTPCPECSPTHQLNHRAAWFSGVVDVVVVQSLHRLIPRSVDRFMQRIAIRGMLFLMRCARIVREAPITDSTHIHQRTRVISEEATRRGLEMRVLTCFGRPTNLFVLHTPEKTHTFEGLPGIDPATVSTTIDDKEEARALCTRLGVPTPAGACFTRLEPALEYARALGFPLVIKPRFGSLSAHTSVDIQTEEDFCTAFRSAKHVSRSVIVDEFIPGSLYRATTVGTRLVACGRRDPPLITGDGIHTLQELFDARDDERKKLLVSLGYKPDKIPPLPQQHVRKDLAAVLPNGEITALTWKVNLAYGASVHDVTDEVHPHNRELFERIAQAVRLPTIGIDFIAPSIAVSWKEQRCACIELNSLPAIDFHHPPIIHGTVRNVAGALLDYVLDNTP